MDRPVVIYVAGTAGGGIDLHARLLARHLGRHIRGNPTVTVQVMPGAGGIRAADHLAKVAPRDGSAMATFAFGPLLEPLIGARNPGYDMSQFTWIGALTRDVGMCLSWGASPFKTIDDVRKREMILAGTGAGSETNILPAVLNHLLGTKFRLVSGYPGTQETMLAIERGEAHGRCISLSALKTAKPEWLRQGKVNLLLQVGLEKSGELAHVPLVFDLVTGEEDRQMIALLAGPAAIARPFAAPSGVPPERASLLRRAFDATMTDPEFRGDAAKMQADISPTTGEEVQKIVARLYATPRPVIDRVRKLLPQ
jgi:tripartite-type tricarboxylate transporter receptor subunit TctC